MKNILILLFALFAVALKADDRTVPGRTLSVTPQNALIHLPEFRNARIRFSFKMRKEYGNR